MTRCFPVRPYRALRVLFASLCLAGVAGPAWAQFETRATAALPNESFAVAVGDFNHDGKLDVAVIGDYLSIFLGNGDGTFQPAVNYAGLGNWIAVADFNNDGNLDLVTANGDNSVSVFLGNGDGTFQSPKISSTTDNCTFVVVGDFNGDQKTDIAVADGLYVSVLLGNGDGTFQAPSDNGSFPGPHQLAVGDFNNDRMLDVAVVGYLGSRADIGVLLGNGDGTLQDSLTRPLKDTPDSVAIADFNGDGKLDVAIGGYLFNEVTVLLGNGAGGFGSERSYPGGAYQVVIGDFNGDGKLDLVAEASVQGAAEFLGNGDGTFQPVKIYGSNHGAPRAAGDLNGDHKLDLVLLGGNPWVISSMLDTGVLSFSPSSPLAFPAQVVNTTSEPKTLDIKNTGSKAVSIRAIKVSGPFEETDTCGGAIAPEAACRVSATFSPLKSGPQSGGITIVDSASSKPQYVELSGVGKNKNWRRPVEFGPPPR
jgi:hypothetical protein